MNSASGVGLIIFKSRTRLTRFLDPHLQWTDKQKANWHRLVKKKKSRNELIEPLLWLRKSASNLVPLLRGVEKKLTGDKWAPLQQNGKYKIHIVLYNYVTLNAVSCGNGRRVLEKKRVPSQRQCEQKRSLCVSP